MITNRQKQRMIERAKPLLPPGTEVRQIMYAQSRSFWGMLLALIPDKYSMIAVTDESIYVLDCGRTLLGYYGLAKPRKLLATLPRATRFGPLKGLTTKVLTTGPQKLRITRAYYGEARVADQAAPPAEAKVP